MSFRSQNYLRSVVNTMADTLAGKLTGVEFKILLFIAAHTIGHYQEHKTMGATEISTAIGISENLSSSSIKNLIKLRLVDVEFRWNAKTGEALTPRLGIVRNLGGLIKGGDNAETQI